MEKEETESKNPWNLEVLSVNPLLPSRRSVRHFTCQLPLRKKNTIHCCSFVQISFTSAAINAGLLNDLNQLIAVGRKWMEAWNPF
jgi:hypothetical protein